MSEIKLIILSIFIILQANSCSNTQKSDANNLPEKTDMKQISHNNIENIIVEYYGGMQSHREVLIITKNKISHSVKNISQPKASLQERETSTELWSKLNQNFNSQEFSKIKSGESQVLFDGMDYVYRIKGSFGEITLTNPVIRQDQNELFFAELQNLLHSFNQNIEN